MWVRYCLTQRDEAAPPAIDAPPAPAPVQVTYTLLGDDSTYPGKVRTALHAAYMQMKFKTHRDVLTNARACLDAVAAALLSVVGPTAAGRVGSIHHHQKEAEPLPSLLRSSVRRHGGRRGGRHGGGSGGVQRGGSVHAGAVRPQHVRQGAQHSPSSSPLPGLQTPLSLGAAFPLPLTCTPWPVGTGVRSRRGDVRG